jgi:hypothetical protein
MSFFGPTLKVSSYYPKRRENSTGPGPKIIKSNHTDNMIKSKTALYVVDAMSAIFGMHK